MSDINNLVKKDKTFIASFIKGFYESEGTCVKGKNLVRMSNTNRELLNLISGLLLKIGIDSRINGPYTRNGMRYSKNFQEYRLNINKQEDSKIFFQLINPCIKNIKT